MKIVGVKITPQKPQMNSLNWNWECLGLGDKILEQISGNNARQKYTLVINTKGYKK